MLDKLLQKEEKLAVIGLGYVGLPIALAFAKKVGAEQTYLTHLSHVMGLHEEVSKLLPDNVAIAFDGLKIEVNIWPS